MRDRYAHLGDGTIVAVSDLPTSVIRMYLALGTGVGGPCRGDLTEEAWRERLEIEFVARSLADAP